MATYIIRSRETFGAQMARIEADSERAALLNFLIRHPEMEDVMIWNSTDGSGWKVAPYDHEEEFYYAELVTVQGSTPWQVFCSLPTNVTMRIVDASGKTLLENYAESNFSPIDNAHVLNIERTELAGVVVYVVTVGG